MHRMIIGLAGSFGGGKGTVVDYLTTVRGFRHYSASKFITEEIVRRGLPVNRNSMIVVANELRAEHGPTYIIDMLYERAMVAGGDAIIESLRAVAEVRRIKELGGFVIGVDADPKLRYERARTRGSEKDNVTYEEWLAQEQKEINPDDPTKQNIFGALDEADVVVQNNGTLEELHAEIDNVLKKISRA
jgi:dephospho-CoA kinase